MGRGWEPLVVLGTGHVGAVNQQDDHEKNRNYWKYLKAKLRKEQSEVVSDTTQLKLTAADGKKYNTEWHHQSFEVYA